MNYRVSRTLPNAPTEWIGTFPTYLLARTFLSTVFHVQPHNRLPWGTDDSDGYLMPEGRYFIMKFNPEVLPHENITSVGEPPYV